MTNLKELEKSDFQRIFFDQYEMKRLFGNCGKYQRNKVDNLIVTFKLIYTVKNMCNLYLQIFVLSCFNTICVIFYIFWII